MKDALSEFENESAKEADKFNWKEFEDKNITIYRWFQYILDLGSSSFPPEKSKELDKIKSDMSLIYSKAKICSYRSKKKCDLGLEEDLRKILLTSRNYEELKYIWKEWRDTTNKKLKKMFLQYLQLSNEMARSEGFKDYGDKMKSEESVKDVEVDKLMEQIKPLYKQIHAYTRRKLIQHYGAKYIRPDGPIPAHILGHMFSQQWAQVFDILNPFSKSASPDVSAEMQRRKMKPIEMFKIAEEFFTSIGMQPMTADFWQKSVIEKPKDKDMVCHASAWNLHDGKDYRIKMCTQVNMGEFVTVHHEMGHIQYYQEYAHLPVAFQHGANTGFHEAVGDTVALSVSTPTHLKKIKLLKNFSTNSNSDIAFLLKMALEKVVFLPSSYIYDSWRWKVFSGEIPQKVMNTQWWKMRNKYEGLCPPVRRTDDDLDPLSKYHVATDTFYFRYFVGHLLQFQFHKALCKESGHKGPLHTCDIYQSKKAGKLFSKMLRLGSLVPWKEALSVITKNETDELSADPLLEYFEPLYKWLKERNRNEFIGWKSSDPTVCPEATDSEGEGADEPIYIEARIEYDDEETDE
ncbi:angiotensin-converting enzyme-like [Uloborus diversus]|uniref:angiotensin-converting enzyme-like n=1 Tax=Uloborus diversus TaxID=327109 RepID=UPI00240A3963|nr:angiotensin-converting enzyme-like [Uloborus diversus]